LFSGVTGAVVRVAGACRVAGAAAAAVDLSDHVHYLAAGKDLR